MTNENNLLQDVKELLNAGFGRRIIAKKLGITQWHARQLISQIKVNINQKVEVKSPIVKIGESNKLVSEPVNKTGKPKILITNQQSATDHYSEINKSAIGLKVAVLSDIHLPYEDTKAVALTKAFLADWRPNVIILNGDICDFYQVSSYDKDNKKRPSFQEELDYADNWLAQLSVDFSDSEIIMTEGNHCNRLSRYLTKNAGSLKSLNALTVEELLGLKRKGIKWVSGDQDIHIGDLMIMHGQSSRKDAGSSVRHHYSMYGSSILIGHIHRGSVAYKRTKQGVATLIENPCLCDISVDYCRFPDWVQGFTTLVFSGDIFSAQTRLIQNYTLITDNKVYSCK